MIADVRAKVTQGRAGSGRRISAVAAGHDRRSHQRAGAGGHQAVFARPRRAAATGRRWWPAPSRRFPAWWTWKTASRITISGTALMFNVDPVVTARAGFTPQEVELDASAMLQGEPAPPPVVLNDRSYTIRVQFPPQRAATARRHEEYADRQRHRQDRHHRFAGHPRPRFPDRPKSSAIICSATCGVTARFEDINLGDGMAKVQKAVADLNVPPSIRVRVRRPICRAAEIVQGPGVCAGAGHRAGLHGSAVRIRQFRRAHCGAVVGAAVDVRRFLGAADHGDHVQPFVVHGADHGDRHRGEERHPAAGCGPEIPRARACPRRRA